MTVVPIPPTLADIPEPMAERVRPIPPITLPAGWQVIARDAYGLAVISGDRLKVIASCEVRDDGRAWYHVSYSRATRLAYEDGTRVRKIFIPRDWPCLSMWPAADSGQYVNVHPYCLHFYATAPDEWPLPSFAVQLPDGRWSI